MLTGALLVRFMFESLTNLYYTFDEWKTLGATYVLGPLGIVKLLTPIEIISGKTRILATLLTNFSLYFAPFQTYPFVVCAYIFHLLNGCLVYTITKKLSRSSFIAFMSGVFFITCSTPAQVFTWLAATYESLFTVFFSLLAIWLYLQLPSSNLSKNHSLMIISWISLIIAYYFKETALVVAVLLPWIYWIRMRKQEDSIIDTLKTQIPLLSALFVIGILRVATYYVLPGHAMFVEQTHPSVTRILFHVFYYPFTTLAQFFIPYNYMVKLAINFYHFQYQFIPPVFSDIGETVLNYYIIADYLSFIISVGLLTAIYFLVVPMKKHRIILVFALLYYFLQHIPLDLYDMPKLTAYFETRYYYVLLPSGAIFFSLLIAGLKNFLNRIIKIDIIAFIIVICIASVFIYKQSVVMKRYIAAESAVQSKMRIAMQQFSSVRSNLPDRPIIYLTGNQLYFGEEDQYIPILPNPGYVLMVWYYKTGTIPGELILEPYNFNHGDGYREIGGKAYGFFTQKDKIVALLKNNDKLSVNQVVGFYYDGTTDTLKDYTQETHNYLNTALQMPL